MQKKLNKFISLVLFFFLVSGCSKKDPITGEIENIETNPLKRARDAADKGGGLFGEIGGKGSKGTTYEFATSNVLWRATLKSLDFLPIANVDYSGGIIVFDWYSDNSSQNEEIKLTIRFLSNEVRSDSLQIIAHKKTCSAVSKCTTTKMADNFSTEIKDQIINVARLIKIEEEKKKK